MRIYLDANASYGPISEVEQKLTDLLAEGVSYNPSSIHSDGQRARALIEAARDNLALLLDIDKQEARIIFTSGATEANNHALSLPFLEQIETAREEATHSPHLIISSYEHPCVLEPAKRLEREGYTVRCTTPETIVDHVGPETRLVSLMLANNETGEIFDVKKIAQSIKAINPKTLIHCDAAQAVGKIDVSFTDLGVDMMSISGHKFGALSGIGALIVKESIPPLAYILGGAQEHRWRSGTENVLGIASLGLAVQSIQNTKSDRLSKMQAAKQFLVQTLTKNFDNLIYHLGSDTSALPNTISVRIPGIKADDLVVALDLLGVSISSGSACASGKPLPSPVLIAMGIPEDEAQETIRISVRHDHSENELAYAGEQIVTCIKRMQQKRAA